MMNPPDTEIEGVGDRAGLVRESVVGAPAQ